MQSLGDSACSSTRSLKHLLIPNNNITLKSYSMGYADTLRNLYLPMNKTKIESYSISNNFALTNLIVPNGVITIGSYAFNNNYSLTNVKIPASVTTIETYAFYNCFSVKYFDFSNHTNIPGLGTNVFYFTANDAKIIVPDELYDDWIVATNWSTYKDKIIKASEV